MNDCMIWNIFELYGFLPLDTYVYCVLVSLPYKSWFSLFELSDLAAPAPTGAALARQYS